MKTTIKLLFFLTAFVAVAACGPDSDGDENSTNPTPVEFIINVRADYGELAGGVTIGDSGTKKIRPVEGVELLISIQRGDQSSIIRQYTDAAGKSILSIPAGSVIDIQARKPRSINSLPPLMAFKNDITITADAGIELMLLGSGAILGRADMLAGPARLAAFTSVPATPGKVIISTPQLTPPIIFTALSYQPFKGFLPAGNHSIAYSAAGFATEEQAVEIIAGDEVSVGDVYLSPELVDSNIGTLIINATDSETGGPLADVVAYIRHNKTRGVKAGLTDNQGVIRFNLPPAGPDGDQFMVICIADGYLPQQGTIIVRDPTEQQFDCSLSPDIDAAGLWLAGRVTLEGEPLGGATVILGKDGAIAAEQLTDADGEWGAEPIREGECYAITAADACCAQRTVNICAPAGSAGETIFAAIDLSPNAVQPPPDTIIIKAPAAITSATEALFTFSATPQIPAAGYECSLNGSPYLACSSPRFYPTLAVGAKTFSVRAIGLDGQADPTPAQYNWIIGAADCDPNDDTVWQNVDLFVDNDGDGIGAGESVSLCIGAEPPPGFSPIDGDCDDSITTGGACAYGCLYYFDDLDGDGRGDPATATEACSEPPTKIADCTDCAPADPAHYSDCGNCIDLDGDGRGAGCNLGPDCDDADGGVFADCLGAGDRVAWAANAGGAGSDYPNGIAALPDGSLLIVGTYNQTATFGSASSVVLSGPDDEIFFARYANNGDLIWARSASGPGADSAVEVDALVDGSFILTGEFSNTISFDGVGGTSIDLTSAGGSDIFLARFDNNGDALWAVSAGGPGNDRGDGVVARLAPAAYCDTYNGSFYGGAVDPIDRIYLAGNYVGPAYFGSGADAITLGGDGSQEAFIAEYGDEGKLLGASIIDGPGDEFIADVRFRPDGGAMVTGWIMNAGPARFGYGEPTTISVDLQGSAEFFLAAYYEGPALDWVASGGGTFLSAAGFNLASRPDGSAIVVGHFVGTVTFGVGEPAETTINSTANSPDFFIARYGAGGLLDWVIARGGIGTDRAWYTTLLPDGGFAVVGDFENTVAFGGVPADSSATSAGGIDPFIARYDGNGNFISVRTFSGDFNDSISNAATDEAGNIFVAGSSQSTQLFFNDSEAGEFALGIIGGVDIFAAKMEQ